MSFLKKGPDLKLSELKVPDFVYDLYYDLKERHLLPLVVVPAISIFVVPIALSRSHDSGSSGEEAATATASLAPSEASTLAVASSAPGLRDYRRRLRYAHALDPFRVASDAAAASEASGSGSAGEGSAAPEIAAVPEVPESTGSVPAEAPVESTAPQSFPSEPAGSETTPASGSKPKYASQAIDVRVVAVRPDGEGANESAKSSAQTRKQLPELTMLPSRKTPLAVFMGTSSDGKKALLLVSSDVQSIFGDGQCIVGSQTCQLLALETGVPETFVYGPKARTYRIEITKISEQLTNEPRRASLGEKKKSEKAGGAPERAAPRVGATQPR